jgi:hypothetical protein
MYDVLERELRALIPERLDAVETPVPSGSTCGVADGVLEISGCGSARARNRGLEMRSPLVLSLDADWRPADRTWADITSRPCSDPNVAWSQALYAPCRRRAAIGGRLEATSCHILPSAMASRCTPLAETHAFVGMRFGAWKGFYRSAPMMRRLGWSRAWRATGHVDLG